MQEGPSIQDGGLSDTSEGPTRRSQRITTPVRQSGMIHPSPDSRRSLTQSQMADIFKSNPKNISKKRPEHPSEIDRGPEPGFKSQATSIDSKNISQKKKQKLSSSKISKYTPSQPDAATSEVIDLAQDSDEENEKVKNKRQRKNPEFDDIKIFFSEPYHRKGDVSELSMIHLYSPSYLGMHANMVLFWKPDNQPPMTYKCLWCKKEVRVSGSSFSNLRTHQDGSRQTGRVSDGFPQRQKALKNGAKLPITSLQESKTKTDKKEGSIASHFNRAEKFDNETLKNIMSLWLLRQAIPWNCIEDPYL